MQPISFGFLLLGGYGRSRPRSRSMDDLRQKTILIKLSGLGFLLTDENMTLHSVTQTYIFICVSRIKNIQDTSGGEQYICLISGQSWKQVVGHSFECCCLTRIHLPETDVCENIINIRVCMCIQGPVRMF